MTLAVRATYERQVSYGIERAMTQDIEEPTRVFKILVEIDGRFYLVQSQQVSKSEIDGVVEKHRLRDLRS